MDRQAVTAPVSMVVALGLFLGSFGALALVSGGVGSVDAEPSEVAHLNARADALLDVMLRSPGYSFAGTDAADWISPTGETGREDALQRLGLRDALEPGLSFAKFENLRLAPYAADGNDEYVNYEEARTALGLTAEGLGFHIRAKPSLPSVQELLASGQRDTNLKVTYLGDSTGDGDDPTLNPPGATTPACTLDAGDRTYTVASTVENTGDQAAQLSAYVTLDPANGPARTEWVHGPELAPGASTTLATAVPVRGGHCATGTTITFDIWDPSERWTTVSTQLDADVGGTLHDRDLILDASKAFFAAGEPIEFAYDGDDLDKNDGLTFVLKDSTGVALVDSISFNAGKNNERTLRAGDGVSGDRALDTLGDLAAGSYLATLSDGTVTATEAIQVYPVGVEPGDFLPAAATGTSSLTPGAVREAAFLDDLVDRFCPLTYDGAPVLSPAPDPATRCDFTPRFPSGDIIPDQKKIMNEELPKRLLVGGVPTYQYVSTLVVGSNVDHQAMTSASAKHAVRDWVLGGGTLIVYGSQEQTVQWLQPIFKAGIDSSSGGTGTPDADHPLLHVSDALAHDQYDHHGRAWGLKDAKSETGERTFTHVVPTDEENGGAVLAISDPGAYGDGTIIVTTWTPYDLFGDGSDPAGEGLKLTNNLLMQGYRGLFLDYGPPIPEGQNVVPSLGRAQIHHPQLDRLVSLDMMMFVFEQA